MTRRILLIRSMGSINFSHTIEYERSIMKMRNDVAKRIRIIRKHHVKFRDARRSACDFFECRVADERAPRYPGTQTPAAILLMHEIPCSCHDYPLCEYAACMHIFGYLIDVFGNRAERVVDLLQ